MDDNSFNDGYEPRIPTFRDTDADREEMVRTFDSTPESKHQEAEESAGVYAKLDLVQKAVSSEKSITLVEDKNDIRRIDEAVERERAAAAAGAASGLATAGDALAASGNASGLASGGAPDSGFDAGGSRGDGSGAAGGPAKPDSLESTLANIRQNGDRQRRLVITGDPMIEKAFLNKLAAAGQLHYSGGSPVATLSRRAALKVLAETVKEFEGASSKHALSMTMQREGRGVIGSISAGIKNNFPLGRSHRLDVVVVGTSDVMDAKLKEVGAFVETMQKKGHVATTSATLEDGKLVMPKDAPVSLKATAQMEQVLFDAKLKVDVYNAAQQDTQRELKAHDHEKKLAGMAKDRAGKADGAEGGTESPADLKRLAKSREHAEQLLTNLDRGFKSTDNLHTPNGKGQVEAQALLHQSRSVRDPAEREIQQMPDAARQKAIIQMQTLLLKADNKEFGDKAVKELDNHAPGTSSIRDKLNELVTMEAKRDPAFAENAKPLLKDLVERKFLTEAQAETISTKVAEAVAAAHQAGSKGDTAKVADAGTASTKSEASASNETVSNANVAQDSKSAPAGTAESKAPASDSTSALAANSASRTEGVKQDRVEPTLADPASLSAPSVSATKAAGEATGPNSDKPLNLRDRIEALAKDGAANLTAEKAHGLVADLDGIRSKPLTALDGGKGTEPTRTLVRAEALLKELATGRFGAELQSQAKDLAEPLQKWEKQDVSRFNNDASVTTLSRDDVVAGVKTGLSKFEGAEPTAPKDAAAPSPAPSKDQASAEPSAPANPEKAPVSASTATSQDAAVSVKAEAAPAAKQEAAVASPQEPAPAKVEAAQPAKMDAAPEVKAAPVQDAAAVAAKELAANRMTETESAGGKLSMMMANPAGSFTNRDKTWNAESIQRAAGEVLRIDPDSVSQMSGPQRAKLAAFSAWIAENARDGKLPGFASEAGKAQASQLVERAASLIGKMDEGSKLQPDVQKSLTKADNMVNAMEQLQKSASATSQTSHEQVSRGGISSNAASALAKDLVHSVYRQPEMSDAQAKYLLKNAANLTPETTKAMDPQTRAQTAVAMGHLAQQVRDGAMGDFSKLPSSVQKNVVAASNAAENMLTQMGKDPSMRAELNQAYSELHAKNAGTSKTAGASATKVDGMEQSTGTSTSAAKSTDSGVTKLDAGVTKADAGASKAAAPAASKSDGRSHDR